jgi:hypothetical protein
MSATTGRARPTSAATRGDTHLNLSDSVINEQPIMRLLWRGVA